MAILTASKKKAFLGVLYRGSQGLAKVFPPIPVDTLLNTLTGFQDFTFSADLKRGRLLTSASGNNHASSFQAVVSSHQITQEEIFDLSQEFLDMYSDAVVALSAQSINSPADSQIYAQMLNDDRLQSVRSYQKDYTALRFPTFGPVST